MSLKDSLISVLPLFSTFSKLLRLIFFQKSHKKICTFMVALQICFSIKFIYSESATKFSESKVEISQNFVAFSEYMNFNHKIHWIWKLNVFLYTYLDIAWWSNKFGDSLISISSLFSTFSKLLWLFFSFKGVKVRVSHNWIHYPVTSQSLAKWCQTVEIEITLFWYSMLFQSFHDFL